MTSGQVRRWGRWHWLLPKSSHVIVLLQRQGEVTEAGFDAFTRWANGEAEAEAEVRGREHDADKARREVVVAIQHSFVTPINPEDLYEVSERLDAVLNAAKDLVQEAHLLEMRPDQAMAHMAERAAEGVGHLVSALGSLAHDTSAATTAADQAIRSERAIERVYRRSMSALLAMDDLREVTGRRELYRRFARLGDAIEAVADRIWYAVMKQG